MLFCKKDMKKILTALALACIVASCATSPGPQLPYDSPDFARRPEVVLVNGKRFLSYQLGGQLRSTQPGIRSKVVDGEVHCFADMFISANAQTDRPRQDRIPDAGAVFWLNPDGSRISLTPNE